MQQQVLVFRILNEITCTRLNFRILFRTISSIWPDFEQKLQMGVNNEVIEMTAREHFILGLRPQLLKRFMMAVPKTFNDAIRIALREESMEETETVGAVETENNGQVDKVMGLLTKILNKKGPVRNKYLTIEIIIMAPQISLQEFATTLFLLPSSQGAIHRHPHICRAESVNQWLLDYAESGFVYICESYP